MLPCDSRVSAHDPLMARWIGNLVPRSRRRAGRAGFLNDLASDHGQRLFEQQIGLCAISGLPFSLAQFPGVLVKHPFAPSLDRVSSKGGYTADNVRLVCIAVNFGMGQWGEELYLTFARAAVARSDRLAADAKVSTVGTNAVAGEDEQARSWFSLQRERIAAAEAIAATLSGEPLVRQRRRLASLKRNLALGPEGLRLAGMHAARTRSTFA